MSLSLTCPSHDAADYTSRLVRAELRESFVRANEVAIFAFMLPQLLLFRLPVVGPLMFLPAAAAAAYLAAFLDRLALNRDFKAGSGKAVIVRKQCAWRRMLKTVRRQ